MVIGVRDAVVATGSDALKDRNQHKSRFMRGGETFKGRLLTTDFQRFAQHGQFVNKGHAHNINSHACIDPKNRSGCPSCVAGVKRGYRTLVWFWDGEKNEIVIKDASASGMDGIKQALKDYPDEILTGTYTISCSDKGVISLSYLPKPGSVTPSPEGWELDDSFLEWSMGWRSVEEMTKLFEGKPILSGDASKTEAATTEPGKEF